MEERYALPCLSRDASSNLSCKSDDFSCASKGWSKPGHKSRRPTQQHPRQQQHRAQNLTWRVMTSWSLAANNGVAASSRLSEPPAPPPPLPAVALPALPSRAASLANRAVSGSCLVWLLQALSRSRSPSAVKESNRQCGTIDREELREKVRMRFIVATGVRAWREAVGCLS